MVREAVSHLLGGLGLIMGRPIVLAEESRIRRAGGFVHMGRVNGHLSLSRAIGDFSFKQNSRLPPEEQAVTAGARPTLLSHIGMDGHLFDTADPDIVEETITADDEFIILACDGIWDCMTSQQAVSFVRARIAEGIPLGTICEQMMDACLAPSSGGALGAGGDNMTLIIVALLMGETHDNWKTKCLRPADLPPDAQLEMNASFGRRGVIYSSSTTRTTTRTRREQQFNGEVQVTEEEQQEDHEEEEFAVFEQPMAPNASISQAALRVLLGGLGVQIVDASDGNGPGRRRPRPHENENEDEDDEDEDDAGDAQGTSGAQLTEMDSDDDDDNAATSELPAAAHDDQSSGSKKSGVDQSEHDLR